MKKWFVFTFIILITSTTILISRGECGIYDPFHSKEEKVSMWKELWNSHPNTSYVSVGKTYAGNDIWLFMAGNSDGGRILFDGEMHGNEDKGSEILYLLAEWLLESGDPEANRILENNHILFIPQLNDQDQRGNANTEISQYGVDLNRNFETGWWQASPSDDTYSGPFSLSEPETQVLRNVFSTYLPIFYVNMHCGAGPYAAYYRGSDRELTEDVISITNAVSASMGITPYRNPSFGSKGFAIGDAVELGVKSAWLIETVGVDTAWRHLPEHYEELVNIYFPKCLALLIAMAESSTSVPAALTISAISQHPQSNIVASDESVIVNATIGSVLSIKNVILNYNRGTQTNYIIHMINDEDDMWSGVIPQIPNGTSVTYRIIVEDILGNTESTEIFSYQTSNSIIPEFSSKIIIILTFSCILIIMGKHFMKVKFQQDN